MEEPQQYDTPHRPPVDRRSIVQLLVVATIVSAGGIALGLAIHWFPAEAATQANKIDSLYNLLIIVTVPIFVLVETVVIFAVLKFRMRPGEDRLDGAPIHGNTRLEAIWTAGPSALIAALVVYAFIVLQDVEKAPAHQALEINVTGQQFAWSFQYPSKAPNGAPIVSDELYLPQGQPVRFHVRATDVLHAFWVPAFRIQVDAVPGIATSYRVTPTRLGNYDVVCNELCGLGHSVMRSTVHVVTPAAYSAWLAGRGAGSTAPAGAGPDQLAALGKRTFTGAAGCSACHTLADAGATGKVGPDLGQFLRGRSEAFIRQSIVQPNAFIEKGYGADIMPGNYSTSLSKDEIDGLVRYLSKVTAK
jgi:cytochrome c oxidase subunit 2